MSNEFKTWTIRIRGVSTTNLNIGRLIVQDECFLSANTKLCDFSNSVCLSSVDLADEFRNALLPVLQKRYGAMVEVTVEDRGTQGHPADDDALVKARLEQNMFAPNRRPKM